MGKINEVISFLEELKNQLNNLKSQNHKVGSDEMYAIKKNIKMVIRRIYPNPKVVESNLFSAFFGIATDDEVYLQESYIKDIDEGIEAINTIIHESKIFGLDDFRPIKGETETKTKIGFPKVFSHEVKKKR